MVPRTAVLLVLMALAGAAPAAAAPVHVVEADGDVVLRDDPYLPAADPLPPPAAERSGAPARARAAARKQTFARVVDDHVGAPVRGVVFGVDVAVAHRRGLGSGVAAGFDVAQVVADEQHPRRIDAELATGQ